MDTSLAEKGVRGRSIVVMHNGSADGHSGGMKPDPTTDPSNSRTNSSDSQSKGADGNIYAGGPQSQRTPTFRRDITFADEVKSPNDDEATPPMLPQRLTQEQHIAFLENQRNPKDKSALRIPGPRDFDRGSVPEPLESDDEDGMPVMRQVTSPWDGTGGLDDNNVKRNITIDEPDHHHPRGLTGHLPQLNTRKSGTLDQHNGAISDDAAPQSARLKQRTGTFSSMRNWASKENAPEAPYLSWQPTVGRNSAFIDLTEEQREELGGIEYRALKTLALVLVCKLAYLLYS